MAISDTPFARQSLDLLCLVFQLHRSIQRGMKNDLKNEYDFDNGIGKAWNRVQVRVSERTS